VAVSDVEGSERTQLTARYATIDTARTPTKPSTLRHEMIGRSDCFRSLI
jgi:hypothetical protein